MNQQKSQILAQIGELNQRIIEASHAANEASLELGALKRQKQTLSETQKKVIEFISQSLASDDDGNDENDENNKIMLNFSLDYNSMLRYYTMIAEIAPEVEGNNEEEMRKLRGQISEITTKKAEITKSQKGLEQSKDKNHKKKMDLDLLLMKLDTNTKEIQSNQEKKQKFVQQIQELSETKKKCAKDVSEAQEKIDSLISTIEKIVREKNKVSAETEKEQHSSEMFELSQKRVIEELNEQKQQLLAHKETLESKLSNLQKVFERNQMELQTVNSELESRKQAFSEVESQTKQSTNELEIKSKEIYKQNEKLEAELSTVEKEHETVIQERKNMRIRQKKFEETFKNQEDSTIKTLESKKSESVAKFEAESSERMKIFKKKYEDELLSLEKSLSDLDSQIKDKQSSSDRLIAQAAPVHILDKIYSTKQAIKSIDAKLRALPEKINLPDDASQILNDNFLSNVISSQSQSENEIFPQNQTQKMSDFAVKEGDISTDYFMMTDKEQDRKRKGKNSNYFNLSAPLLSSASDTDGFASDLFEEMTSTEF